MYKKITCALCCVISVFIIAVVVYLMLTEWQLFSEEPLEIQVPEIHVYSVDGGTGDERRLPKLSNSDYILNLQNLELGVHDRNEPKSRLRIRCHSNYPVQLKYIGFGNVTEATNLNRRQIEDFADRSSYKYSTELEFTTVDEGITGKYDCQVRDEINQGSIKATSSVYIYAAGLNSFVSHSSRELIVEPGSFIEIPCAVSHPTKSISLFLVKPLMDTEFVKHIEEIHSYDPKRGFILGPDQYGVYFCKDTKTEEVSGRISVLLPLNKVVKGSQVRIYSQNVDNKHKSLRLECKARDPVDLKFINFSKFTKKLRLIKDNDSAEFPYIAKIKINVDWFRGNMSVVECVTIGSRRIVKTWKFLKEDMPDSEDSEEETHTTTSVKLEPVKNVGFQCCTHRLNMNPILRTYPCNTPTECDFRTPCLSIDPLRRTPSDPICTQLEAANEDIYQANKSCTILKLKNNGSSGIIRCSLDADVRDYAYFHYGDMDGAFSSISNIQRKKIEPGAILKLTEIGARSAGTPYRFVCEGSKLHFSYGFQWALYKPNEPLKYLSNRPGLSFRSGRKQDPKSPVYHEWIDIPHTDRGNHRVYCFAPLILPALEGSQWVNVSVPFRYDIISSGY